VSARIPSRGVPVSWPNTLSDSCSDCADNLGGTNRFFIHMRPGPQYDMREEVFDAGDYPGSPNLMANTLFQDWLYGYDVVRDAEARWRAREGFSSKL
jgi:hypothetical protein